MNLSSGQPALIRRSSEIKPDSPGMEISVLEQLAAEIPRAEDVSSQSEGMGSLLSKGKESLSPKSSFPSVSITPVTSIQPNNINLAYPNINLERQTGIEIIPFNKDPSGGLPSSLTITPVGNSSNSSSSKSSKDKSSKYKDGKAKESGFDSPDRRDRDKERERKERKRRREEEKSPNSSSGGGKPSKMMSMSSTLMGPPGSVPKMEGSPSRNHKSSSSSSTGSNHSSGSTPPTSSGLSPLMSPSKSSSKGSTPSSSPKHPSSGGKPSMSALSMSALKCKWIFACCSARLTSFDVFQSSRFVANGIHFAFIEIKEK